MGLFRRKKKKESVSKETVPVVNKEEMLARAQELEKDLSSLNGKERINCLNELGSLYYQAGEDDKAIEKYEISIDESKSLGKAYTDLLKLYNVKRQEAAEAKNDVLTKEYLDKISYLMQLSKDVIRGKV